MSKADPAANSNLAGTGQTWFKVYEMPPVYKNGALTFPSESTSVCCINDESSLRIACPTDIQQFTFPLPKTIPNGQYLVRVEHVRRVWLVCCLRADGITPDCSAHRKHLPRSTILYLLRPG